LDFFIIFEALFREQAVLIEKFLKRNDHVMFVFTKQATVGTYQTFVFHADQISFFWMKQASLKMLSQFFGRLWFLPIWYWGF